MPSELEELVGFIANPNPQIRLVAAENLVPYSLSQPSLFMSDELKPIKHLKFLVRDDPKTAEHVITMLVNLSGDSEVLECLATDEKFIGIVLEYIIHPEEKNANLLAMLLANMAKSHNLKSILSRKQPPPDRLSSNDLVANQLLDLFVKGVDGSYNKHADYDYLAYFFADLAKHPEVRDFFVTRQDYDGVVPLTKLRVFTEHKSDVRRKGVASTIKNSAFDFSAHPLLLAEEDVNLLPYILLPIMGSEGYDEDDMLDMLPDLQLLPPDKQREPDVNIIRTHVETLLLLMGTRKARELMRRVKVYPVMRETHRQVDDEGVREACERLVQLLEGTEEEEGDEQSKVQENEEDEDDQIVEV